MEFCGPHRSFKGDVKKTLYAAVCSFFCISGFASASLVIYNDGRIVKAVDYHVSGDDVEIVLSGGGGYTTSMMMIERIVDDEVVPALEEGKPNVSKHLVFDLTYKSSGKLAFRSAFDRMIDEECRKANLDSAFVSAIIKAESNFNPYARSRKGALGLMQLMPATAARLGVRRWFDPEANIRGGVRYLKALCVRFSNTPELVLAAYNAGEDAVDLYQGVPPYRETVGYVKRILGWWSPAAKSPSV